MSTVRLRPFDELHTICSRKTGSLYVSIDDTSALVSVCCSPLSITVDDDAVSAGGICTS
jgi:hypothetical protein